MRLPRKHSMTRRTEFVEVRKNGRVKAGRFVVLSTLDAPELPCLKVAFITTKRVGKAHERNLLRRRLRALVQKHGGRLIDPHRYLVTIPRPGSAAADFEELEKDWLKQARRLGLMGEG